MIVKGSGGAGLGDKIRAVIVGAMYCQLTGRSLYVDWRDSAYGDERQNYFPDLFKIKKLPALAGLPVSGTVLPHQWSGRLHLSLDEIVQEDNFEWSRAGGIARYSFDQSQLVHPADHLVMWEMDQFDKVRRHYEISHPEVMVLADEELAASVLSQHLQVCDKVQAAVDSFCETNFTQGQPIIGVHVRLSDESEGNRRNPGLAQFIRVVRRALKGAPAARIFLATDNTNVIKSFMTEFGHSNVLFREKWLPAAGHALHGNQECPDKLQNARDALIDAYLLGKCEWLITSISSSFSMLARVVSNAPAKNRKLLFPSTPIISRIKNRVSRLVRKTQQQES
ncbi:nodulation protein NodZ [Pseudomonadota bacterium]